MDWGGHPSLFEDRFSNSSKFDEKRFGGSFCLLSDWYSFPPFYNSVISRSRLVFCLAYNLPYGTILLRKLEYSSMYMLINFLNHILK